MGITQLLHTFTGQGFHEFTILSIVLALIGTLFISYELLGRQFKVLRIALQIITPALATALPWILCILLFLWFPSYQEISIYCLAYSWSSLVPLPFMEPAQQGQAMAAYMDIFHRSRFSQCGSLAPLNLDISKDKSSSYF